MFLDFFLLLKNDGFPVTLKEYLTFLEALDRDVIGYDTTDFYYLSRCVMVKDERHLDRFDKLFSAYFRGAQLADTEQFMQIPLEWLRKNFENALSEEDKQMIRSMGGLEELMERLKEIFEKQKKRHQGGNRWIGTGGTSPYGAYGYNPAGVRIGQDGGRQRRAVKVWDKREFRDLDDSVELNVRNMKMALRKRGWGRSLTLRRRSTGLQKTLGCLTLNSFPRARTTSRFLCFLTSEVQWKIMLSFAQGFSLPPSMSSSTLNSTTFTTAYTRPYGKTTQDVSARGFPLSRCSTNTTAITSAL